MPKKARFLRFTLAIAFLACSVTAVAEELLSDQEVLAEPKASSAPSGKVKKGQVAVLEKKGFWVKIKSGETTGWTKLSNLKADSSGSLGLPETGRTGGGNIVSTSGVRGLDGGDLVNAKPDPAEFDKFKLQLAGKRQGDEFASSGGLSTRKISYINPTKK